jgi:hypothetical protein
VREGLVSGAWDSSGVLGKSFSSETASASARMRSSHLPRTPSILLPMRWVGRLGMIDGVEVLLPVVRELIVETEPDLESDPAWVDPRSRRRA